MTDPICAPPRNLPPFSSAAGGGRDAEAGYLREENRALAEELRAKSDSCLRLFVAYERLRASTDVAESRLAVALKRLEVLAEDRRRADRRKAEEAKRSRDLEATVRKLARHVAEAERTNAALAAENGALRQTVEVGSDSLRAQTAAAAEECARLRRELRDVREAAGRRQTELAGAAAQTALDAREAENSARERAAELRALVGAIAQHRDDAERRAEALTVKVRQLTELLAKQEARVKEYGESAADAAARLDAALQEAGQLAKENRRLRATEREARLLLHEAWSSAGNAPKRMQNGSESPARRSQVLQCQTDLPAASDEGQRRHAVQTSVCLQPELDGSAPASRRFPQETLFHSAAVDCCMVQHRPQPSSMRSGEVDRLVANLLDTKSVASAPRPAPMALTESNADDLASPSRSKKLRGVGKPIEQCTAYGTLQEQDSLADVRQYGSGLHPSLPESGHPKRNPQAARSRSEVCHGLHCRGPNVRECQETARAAPGGLPGDDVGGESGARPQPNGLGNSRAAQHPRPLFLERRKAEYSVLSSLDETERRAEFPAGNCAAGDPPRTRHPDLLRRRGERTDPEMRAPRTAAVSEEEPLSLRGRGRNLLRVAVEDEAWAATEDGRSILALKDTLAGRISELQNLYFAKEEICRPRRVPCTS